jgi:hypothetical protein
VINYGRESIGELGVKVVICGFKPLNSSMGQLRKSMCDLLAFHSSVFIV